MEDGTHCEEASQLAAHKLRGVREKLADLQSIERALTELLHARNSRSGQVSCPLVTLLQQRPDFVTMAAQLDGTDVDGTVQMKPNH